MRLIADFHIHSKYSRATSHNMVIDLIAQWAKWKGIGLVGTGDFTHPLWFSEIKNKLVPLGNGLFASRQFPDIKFILTTEISSIYTQNNKVRKIHNLIFASSLETVQKINDRLLKIGNLYSDGRPILGLSAYDLAQLVLNVDPSCLVIPAHAWTPWFSIFGSNSGFDSIEECFGDLTPKIFAIETGLSSDPEMNWRLSKLDPITLISCSDAHSPANLGREATVFDITNSTDLNYSLITQMIKNSRIPQLKPPPTPKRVGIPTVSVGEASKLDYTIEFFPEEGKYHFDGHRLCNATRLSPSETNKYNGLCPVCDRPLTVGVSNRVEKLADRPEGFRPQGFPGTKHLIPLQEIIAESLGVQKNSVKVQEEYKKMIQIFQNEFRILLDESVSNISNNYNERVAEGIGRMREGKVTKIPGYDGVYGVIKVFDKRNGEKSESRQTSLF